MIHAQTVSPTLSEPQTNTQEFRSHRMSQTISALIAAHDASAPAIGAPDRDWLTYGGLRDLASSVTETLHGIGIGCGTVLRLCCRTDQKWQRRSL